MIADFLVIWGLVIGDFARHVIRTSLRSISCATSDLDIVDSVVLDCHLVDI